MKHFNTALVILFAVSWFVLFCSHTTSITIVAAICTFGFGIPLAIQWLKVEFEESKKYKELTFDELEQQEHL